MARSARECRALLACLRLLCACAALATSIPAALSTPASSWRRHLLSREDAVEHAAEQFDWPLVYHNVPWLAPPGHRFHYVGVTELEQLAKLQSSNGWVTVFLYTKPTSRWALNLVYSLVQFASVSSYMAGALDKESLADCQSWRLPCFDASWAIDGSVGEPDKPALLFSSRFMQITWAKPKVLDRLLELNYTVHITDTDIIYIRDAYQSYATLFKVFRMDAAFMRENPVNGGAYVIRANNRTQAFMRVWLAAQVGNDTEQDALAKLHDSAHVICETVEDCARAKARNMMAVYRHEMQFEETNCPSTMGYPCHPDRLYVHAVCMTYGAKAGFFAREGLWLVDLYGRPNYISGLPQARQSRWRAVGSQHAHGSQPNPHVVMSTEPPDDEVMATLNNHTLVTHTHFPCSWPAWRYLQRDVQFQAYTESLVFDAGL